MLYNPNWNKTSDPFALSSLIAWLQTQPPEQKYNYISSRRCLLAQYFRAKGFKWMVVLPKTLYHGWVKRTPFSNEFEIVANNKPWTVGAALERAQHFEHMGSR